MIEFQALMLLRNRRGSLLIDALLAVSIFGAIVAAFSSGIMQGQLGTVTGSDRIRAAYLADEGLQAVRWIRNQENALGENTGYDQIYGYSLGTNHGVKLVNGTWTIQTGSPTTVDTLYTRSIKFTAGSSENERIVQSTVSWTGAKGARSITLTSLLTNFQEDPPPPPPDWSRPILVGSLEFPSDDLEKIALSADGTKAYIVSSTDTRDGFYVVNVSVPASLSLIDSAQVNDDPAPAPSAKANNIAIRGNYAYVTTDHSAGEKIRILDITAPDITCCAGSIDTGTSTPHGIAFSGRTLFITKENDADAGAAPAGDELLLYNADSTPTAPSLVNSWDNAGAGPGETFNLFDIAPTHPYGTEVYMAGNDNGELIRVDVAKPASQAPVYEAGMNLSGNDAAFAVALVRGTGAFLGRIGSNGSYDSFSSDVETQLATIPESSHVDFGGEPNQATTYDIAVSQTYKIGFLATALQMDTSGPHACTPDRTRHYFVTMDFSNAANIDSPEKILYKGQCGLLDPPNNCLLAANKFCTECTYDPLLTCSEEGKGIAFDEAKQTAYLITGGPGDPPDGPKGHLLIFQPTYEYD